MVLPVIREVAAGVAGGIGFTAGAAYYEQKIRPKVENHLLLVVLGAAAVIVWLGRKR